jgi:ATP-dependent DNA helicase RecG
MPETLPESAPLHPDDPVDRLPGIGAKRVALLEAAGVRTLYDLLHYFPRDYRDYAGITPIAGAVQDATVTVRGVITASRNIRLRGRQSLAHITLRDATGTIGATFFGRGFLADTVFRKGLEIIITGKLGNFKGPCLSNPEYEILGGDDEDRLNTGRIVPVYPLVEGLTQRMLRRWVRDALDAVGMAVPECLPLALLKRLGLPGIGEALPAAHFPEKTGTEITEKAGTVPSEANEASGDGTVPALLNEVSGDGTLPVFAPVFASSAENARHRFVFEELFLIQLEVLLRRERLTVAAPNRSGHVINGPHLRALDQLLAFPLTGAQERVISEILRDMAGSRPMLRLVQGDVGCGKTVVALHAVVAAADGGFQTAFMAPTEILAEQHALVLRGFLEPLGLHVETLIRSTPEPAKARRRIASGEVDVILGTHTLFQEKTRFHRLGLVVIDEQHRFGVLQRALLAAKGPRPDLLQMSATPIPRTIALTLYGEMDLSIIDEMPPGRLPVKTRRVSAAKVPDLYRYLREQSGLGFQSYIVCPLVDESETKGALTPLLRHFEEISTGPLAGVPVSMLHGRMDPAEKEAVMTRFKTGEARILFSTTVIEVGVDVARATVMVIENAADFGLTQLHQLRGRVGRGADQSFCFLLGEPRTPDGKRRLEALCAFNSGFDIAEEDLKLRGPGEFHGLRQAGLGDLRIADLVRDARVIDLARREAQALLEKHPGLNGRPLVPLVKALARHRAGAESPQTDGLNVTL